MRTILAALICATIASPALAVEKKYCASSPEAWKAKNFHLIDHSRTKADARGYLWLNTEAGAIGGTLGRHQMEGFDKPRYCLAVHATGDDDPWSQVSTLPLEGS